MAVLVGKAAPDFKAPAVIEGGKVVSGFTLSQFKHNKYVVLFFYPADFTFVCPTELHAFQQKIRDFESHNVQLIACSVDSENSHWKWLQTPKQEGGIQGVTYPIVADQSHQIAKDYDVLAGDECYDEELDKWAFEGTPQSYRGLFLIDKEGIVRHQVVNDMPLGRNVDEVLRMVEALQFVEKYGEVCPANWHEGSKGMKPTHEGVAKYLSEQK